MCEFSNQHGWRGFCIQKSRFEGKQIDKAMVVPL
jgi:hypothetical protein